jgi:hypothetical protein
MKPKPNLKKLASKAWVSSDERLAAIFGHHRRSFSQWRKDHTDAPRPRADGSHNVEAWREWFAKHPEIKSDEPPSAQKLALQVETLREQLDHMKFEHKVAKGKFLSTDYVTRMLSELSTLLNSTLRTKLEDELPPILAGMPAAGIRIEMKKVHDEICRMMQEGSAKMEAQA